MKKLSLRLRLTLFIVLLLTGICVVMTLLSLYNANNVFVMPYISTTITDFPADRVLISTEAVAAEVASEPAYAAALTQSSTEFNALSLWTMVAVIGGGGLLAYFLLGRALKPLHELSGEISAVTENELSQRIEKTGAGGEISSLADSFNTMLARLDKAFSDQKRFSSDAAHELKTPLAAIKTNIDVLKLDEKPPIEEYEKTVNVIEKQTGRMIRLVDDLFTMSAQREYDFNDTVKFDAMFQEIIAQLEPRIAEKNLSVHLEESGFATRANSVMLTRAFSNLVENAVKYNQDGGSIAISATGNDKEITFAIADTGVGIPEERIKDIFKPFYRVDHSRSRKIGGAGLGLAIAKDVIERHGGSVSAAPAKGGGTVFTVTLPRITHA